MIFNSLYFTAIHIGPTEHSHISLCIPKGYTESIIYCFRFDPPYYYLTIQISLLTRIICRSNMLFACFAREGRVPRCSGEGLGAVIKAACLVRQRSRVRTHSGLQVSTKQNVSSLLTRKDSILGSLRD